VKMTSPFILSYDYSASVEELYGQSVLRKAIVELNHTASGNGSYRRAREVILTNLDRLPGESV